MNKETLYTWVDEIQKRVNEVKNQGEGSISAELYFSMQQCTLLLAVLENLEEIKDLLARRS